MVKDYFVTITYTKDYSNVSYTKAELVQDYNFNIYDQNNDKNDLYRYSVKTKLGNIIFSLSKTSLKLCDQYTHRLRYGNNPSRFVYICFILHSGQDWSQVYLEFTKFATQIRSYYIRPFPSKQYHEIFKGNRPTRMFLDLDPHNIVLGKQEFSLIAYHLSSIVGRTVEYIVFKNSNNDHKHHILFTNFTCDNITTCSRLGKELKESFPYIDIQPYNHNASLRMWGSYKGDKHKLVDYIVGSDICKPYFIQPYQDDYKFDFVIPEYKRTTQFKIERNLYSTNGVDLSEFGLAITTQYNGNIYNCIKTNKNIECPVCQRHHDKSDANFAVLYRNIVRIGCFRDMGNYYNMKYTSSGHTQISDLSEYDEEIDDIQFDPRRKDYSDLKKYLEQIPIPYKRFMNQTIYNNPSAQMPDTINGNCLYLVSPCKTGKTNLIHGYIENLPADKSICFITCQRLLTTDLHQRFKDLGFISYLQEDFKQFLDNVETHNRVFISINSLHKIKRDYDIVIIDEVETLHSCFTNYMIKLGHQEYNKKSVKRFNSIIKSSELCILMDAYPSLSTIQLFEKHDKKVHIHINDYKTHKDDTIIFVGETAYFIDEMAKCIANKQPIVFASSLRVKQEQIMEQLYIVLQTVYKVNIQELKQDFYNSTCDAQDMVERIKNLKETWSELDILCYTPTISAGVNYTEKHFSKVFYLGNANSGHVSALQSLYRVRDVDTCEYYILFGSTQYENPAYSLRQNYEYFLNMDRVFINETENKRIADTLYNETLLSSERYALTSRRRYLENFVGQFKYNGSKIEYRFMTLDEELTKPNTEFCNWDSESKLEETFDLLQAKKKEASLKIRISDVMKTFINDKPLIEEDFIILSDADFNSLNDKVNKSNYEKDIILINTFSHWFPKFHAFISSSDNTLESKKEFYNSLKKELNTYNRYYLNYKYGQKFAEVDDIHWSSRVEKNKKTRITDTDPEQRFIMKCATKVLSYLSGYDDSNAENIYETLHNCEYQSFDMETVQCAFDELFRTLGRGEDEFKKRFFTTFYANDIRKSSKFVANYPTEINEWNKMRSILTKVLKQTYGFTPNNSAYYKKAPCISLVRNITLF